MIEDIEVYTKVIGLVPDRQIHPQSFRRLCIQLYPAAKSFLPPSSSWKTMYLSCLDHAKYAIENTHLSNGIGYAISIIKKPHKKPKPTDWEKIFHCALCWRFTPARMGRHLCTHHEPRDKYIDRVRPEYKSALRMKGVLRKSFYKVKASMMNVRVPESDSDFPSWLAHHLPRVAQHTKTANLSDILVELDDKDDPHPARDKLHNTIIENRQQARSILILCEAWWMARETVKHGGRRPGAGRPRKSPQRCLP